MGSACTRESASDAATRKLTRQAFHVLRAAALPAPPQVRNETSFFHSSQPCAVHTGRRQHARSQDCALQARVMPHVASALELQLNSERATHRGGQVLWAVSTVRDTRGGAPALHVHCHVRSAPGEDLEAAVLGGRVLLEDVPWLHRTARMCTHAVASCPEHLQHVPAALRTPALCTGAVTANPRVLRHVPAALRTPTLCARAVQAHPHLLRDVPDEQQTNALVLRAVQGCGSALQYVAPARCTLQVCLAAVQHDPDAARWVPPEVLLSCFVDVAAHQGTPLVLPPPPLS